MNTDTRTNVGIQVGAIVGLILIIIALVFMRGCESKPQLAANNYDSIVNVLKAKDKYIGIVEIDLSKANEARVKAENELRDRKPIYIERVERIIANAPDTCKEYLIAVRNECDTMGQKYQAVIDSTQEELCKMEDLKNGYKDKTETLQHFNNKLTDENKAKDEEIADLNKTNKWQKRWANFGKGVVKVGGAILVGAAVVYTGVVMYFTVVK